MIAKLFSILFLVYCFSKCSYAEQCEGYTYIEATNSYYKVHNNRSNWVDAMQTCMDEVSVFYHPLTVEEAELIKNWSTPLIEYRPYNADPVIHVGLNDLREEGKFETVNGIPISEVYSKWKSGNPDNHNGDENCVQLFYKEMDMNDINCEYDDKGSDAFMYILPFICRRKKPCVEEDPKYIYSKVSGSSYSLVLQPQNWTDAEANCTEEGAHLAIINSQEEAAYLSELVAAVDPEEITEPFLWGAVHLGFHNREDKGWETVKGENLEESGYTVWGNGQPDGEGPEKCGSMFLSGRLNDIRCDTKCIFICEKTTTKKA